MTTLMQVQTLGTSSSSSPDAELFTPPPSHATLQQVPDVFVIPPEEEHGENPPFCYFDAAMESKKSFSMPPDMDALDAALGMAQQRDNRAPVFSRSSSESQDTVVMPRRGANREAGVEVEARGKRRLLDGDVVEVMRVRRNDNVSNTPEEAKSSAYAMKKSKTFRSRASQALKSIKNVGRTTRKQGIPEAWTSDADSRENDGPNVTEDGILSSISRPSVATKKPLQLSRVFSSARSKSPAPDVPTSPTSPTTPTSTSSSSSEWSAVSRPSLSVDECLNMNAPFPMTADPTDDRSLNAKRSFVRRISYRDIQRLFINSNPTKPPPSSSSTFRRGSESGAFSSSRLTTASSELSSLGMEDVFAAAPIRERPRSYHGVLSDPALSVSIPTDLSYLPPASAMEECEPEPAAIPEVPEEVADSSFELRLDSLQFDSLQFDPDEFCHSLNM